MTKETGDVSPSKEVPSLDPLLSAKVRTVAPMDSPLAKKQAAFLYSQNMFSTGIRADIDSHWEACWPINTLRPLVLLDLLSYLLFIKQLEEQNLVADENAPAPGAIFRTKFHKTLSWTAFKDLDAAGMHQLFTKENGIPDLMKGYSNANLLYSLFVKEPLLLVPTGRLLTNMANIIKVIEAQDRETGGAIFEYLLTKMAVVAQNGQVYAPAYAVKLMVQMMQPTPDDVIGDPSAGNAAFLVNSAQYIAQKNTVVSGDLKNEAVANIYKGIESDLVQLRIGAMNMIMHGIEDPKLEGLNVFSKANLTLHEQPTLIFSNLYFESIEDKTAAKSTELPTENRRPEIRFLNIILKNLRIGGRSAVIVRESILYDNTPEIKSIRRQVIDDFKMEAVICLPGTSNSAFANASILVFSRREPAATDKVWFCRLETKKGINIKDASESVEDYDNVPEILGRWKNEIDESRRSRTDKSFYVPVSEIKANNYNLSFNEYGRVNREMETPATPATVTPMVVMERPRPAPQQVAVPETPNGLPPERRPVKKISRVIVSVLFVGLALFAGYFIFYNNDTPPSIPLKNTTPVSLQKNKPEPPPQPVKTTPAAAMLSQEQIKAILNDTSGILHFREEPGNTVIAKEPKTSPAKFKNVAVLVPKIVDKPVEPPPVSNTNALKVQYLVTDTTYFHDQPDEGSRRKSFLDPVNKNILTPIDDQNGYIYVVYTNHSGRTSKGWINKKTLKPIQ
jgi:type I restriction enzyme M protein